MDQQLPDDGLKWFGEGFDGFPRRLPDDCVEYIIHIVDQRLHSVSAVRTRLSEVLKASKYLMKTLLKDYIWQRQSFELHLQLPEIGRSKPSGPGSMRGPPHLRGRTAVGDSVADEWLVVYLLRELSKQFPDAWMRVYDTDGEFLLIEAANALPKWISPEIAEARVWINQGHLKIIPLEDHLPPRNLTSQAALSVIQKKPSALLTDNDIERNAFHRLREYPSAISSSLHHALISVPRRIAHILHRNPAYISSAVEAFYMRDPVSLKPLATKDLAILNFPPDSFVTVSVRFPKVAYAQLRSQVFDAPPAWTGILPRLRDEKVVMGMKLTCGFEMLVADAHNQDQRNVQEIKLLLEDIATGAEKLPSNVDIAEWPQTQDDENWLNIDYHDFEKELSGNGQTTRDGSGSGFGDQSAQDNLRKMVERFEDFMKDDEASAEGVDDMYEDDDAESGESEEDKDPKYQTSYPEDDIEYRQSLKETQAMDNAQIDESGLLEEARKLALQDADDECEVDEDEEMRKIIELMEQELKGHGALDLGNGSIKKMASTGRGKEKATPSASVEHAESIDTRAKPCFGPERPPHMLAQKFVRLEQVDDMEVGPGDSHLSSDDEDYNDVDLGLAENMLESFKGQAGLSGPAGNLMRALGTNMPRDEDIDF